MTKSQTKFFSVTSSPIDDIEEGKKLGKYDWIYDWITPEHTPLQKAEGEKTIYFVPVDEDVESGKETEFLAKHGMKLVENSPNYLLGAMAKLSKSDLPENLKNKDLVAMSAASVFQDESGDRCFLYVSLDGGRRRLGFVRLDGGWYAGRGWVFLAEPLESNASDTLSLEPSDTLNLSAENLAIDFCEKWVDGKARAVIELRDKILELIKP